MKHISSELRKGSVFYPMNRNREIHMPIEVAYRVLEIHSFKVLAIRNTKKDIIDVEWNEFDINDISPISLTPELLVKIGFENKGGWVGKTIYEEIWDENIEIVFEFMDNILTVYADDRRVRIISNPSLHQLQNLYYCLTGIELEINL